MTITVNNVNDDPVITAGGDPAPTFEETGPAVIVDAGITITDVDTANFDTGSLRAAVTGNLDAGDSLLVQETGGITLSGSDVLFNGIVIGAIDGTYDGSVGDLLIALDSDATPAAVQALARAIAFANDTAIPATVDRTVTFTVDTGDGGTVTQDATVQVVLESGLTRSDHDQLNGNGDWFDPANWTSDLPDATTIAIVNGGEAGATFFNNGPVNETVAQLFVNADLNILAGTLNILGTSEVGPAAQLSINAAAVAGTGSITVLETGTLSMDGASSIAQDIAFSYTAGMTGGAFLATGTGNTITGDVTIGGNGDPNNNVNLEDSRFKIGDSSSSAGAILVVDGTITNDGIIQMNGLSGSGAASTLQIDTGSLINNGLLSVSGTAGDPRMIDGSIDNSTGKIQINTSATIINDGHTFDTATGEIQVSGSSTLTIQGGITVIGTGTTLTDNATGTIAFSGAATLTLESDAGIVSTDPVISFGGPSDAVTVTSTDLTPHSFGIGAGATLTLTGSDQVTGTVNLDVLGTLAAKGLGNTILGGLAIAPGSGALNLIADGGDTDLAIAQGFTNNGNITLDNTDSSAHGVTLSLAGGLNNAGTLTVSDSGGGGGNRFIFGSIDNAGGGIVLQTDATIANTGGVLNNGNGTIDVGSHILTVNGGQIVVDSGSLFTGAGALDLTGAVNLHLVSNFTLAAGGADLNLVGTVTIDGTVGEGAPTFFIDDGRTLTLDGDTVADTVNLSVSGVLNIAGTGTTIAAATNINAPNGVFNVEPGATVTLTGVLDNNDGVINVAAGGILILDGANIENTGIITGEGTIQLANGAEITGNGIIDVAGIDTVGTLNITGGAVVFDTETSLDIDIGGGGNDVLNLDTMDLTAAGEILNLNFAPGFDPIADGNTFQILTYTGHDTDLNDDTTLDNIFDTIQHNLGPEYTVTIDYGSTAATVTVNRNPEIAVTTNGQGMQFDGVDDIIRIPADGTVNALTSITVEAVITLAELPAGPARIAENFSGDYDGWGFTIHTDGTLSVELGDGGGSGQLSNFYTVPGAISAGDPSHVAFTYDGDITVYVNGVAVDGTAGGVNPIGNLGPTTSDVLISHPAFPLNGVIDEFRIYDGARTAAEVASDAGGGTTGVQPLVHYDFADGTADNKGSLDVAADGILGGGTGGPVLSFDGVNDTMQASNAAFAVGANAYTIEVLFSTTAGAGDQNIISLGDGPTGGAGVNVNINNGFLGGGLSGVGGLSYASPLNDGQPHHLALTFDGTDFYELFIDGVSVSTFTNPGSTPENIVEGLLTIGQLGDGQRYFNGEISEVRFYDDVRNPTEITDDASGVVDFGDPALLAFYDAEPTSVTDGALINLADPGNGDAVLGTAAIAGEMAAQQFDGNDQIFIPNSAVLDNATQLTVEAVINPTALGDLRIVEKLDNFTNFAGWSFEVLGNGGLMVTIGNDGGSPLFYQVQSVGGIVTAGENQHVTFSYDDATGDVRFYVDGVEHAVSTGTVPAGTLTATPTDITIGDSPAAQGQFSFNGTIGEVRIYDDIRTATEVAGDAAGGNTSDANLQVRLDFDPANISGHTVTNQGNLGMTGDATLGSGRGGPALSFDGGDIITATDAGLQLGGGAFTIEAIVTTTQVSSTFLSLGNGAAQDAGVNMILDASGLVGVGLAFRSAAASATPINDGQPHHVAFTHNGSGTYELYVDGAFASSFSISPTQAITLGQLTLGQLTDGAQPYNGALADVRVYGDARTAAEIAADARGELTGDALLVHYDMDPSNISGSTLTNQGSLSGADGALGAATAAPTQTTITDTAIPTATTLIDTTEPAVTITADPAAPIAVPLIGQALSFDGTVAIEVTDTTSVSVDAATLTTGLVITNAGINGTEDTVADFNNTPGVFNGVNVGDVVTLSGFSNGSNNVTATVTAVALDGSSISFADGTLGANNGLASVGTIDKPSNSPLATGDGAFTYEAWFRTDSPANPQTIIRVGDPSGTGGQVRVTGDGRIQALAPDAGPTTLESALGHNDGLWHHVAFTYDGSGNLQLIVDGEVVDTGTATINSIDVGTVIIGGYTVGNQPFEGEIFDVRAYDVARSQSDILLDMNELPDGTDPTLTGAWHLDDVLNGTTDQFRDVTGNGGTGTYSGSTPVFEDTNLFTMAEDAVLHGRITGTDVDGDTAFTYGVEAQGANGTVTVNPDGTWTYAPNADFFGADTFEVSVTDSLGATATKEITVSVLNVNDAPVATGAFVTAGTAMQFDGVDDKITASNAAFATGAAAFTYEARFTTSYSGPNFQEILLTGVQSTNAGMEIAITPAGVLTAGINNVFVLDAPGTINDGESHHVAFSHDGSGNYSLYLDGVLVDTHTGSVPNITVQDLWVGTTDSGTNPFDGLISDVRFYDDVRTADEVLLDAGGQVPLSPGSENLQVRYDFDGFTGQTVTNQGALGSGADGTLGASGGVDAGDPVAVAFNGRAMDFNGSNQAVDAGRGADDSLAITGDLTIETWFRPEAFAASGSVRPYLFVFGENGETLGANALYGVYINDTGDLVYVHESQDITDETLTFDTNLTLGDWYHLAVSRDTAAKTVTLYLNGEAVGAPQSYTDQAAGGGTSHLSIGSLPGSPSTYFFDGQMFDVRIYDETRDAATIAADMTGALNTADPGLIAAWPLNDADGSTIIDVAHGNDGTFEQAGSPATPTLVDTNPLSAIEDGVLTGRIIAHDVDGDTLTFTAATGGEPMHGTVFVNSDGTFEYTPAPDYFGPDAFTVDVFDGTTTVSKSISVTVDAVNDAPVILGAVQAGNALSFDGVDDVIVAGRGDGDAFAITGDLTLELWFKPSDLTGARQLLSFLENGETAADNAAYDLNLDANGDITFQHEYGSGSNEVATFATGFAQDEWHHVAAVRDATAKTFTLYVDGEQFGAPVAYVNDAVPGANAQLFIGSGGTGDATPFAGQMDDIRIWNSARTAEDIADNYQNPNVFDMSQSLVAHYSFDNVQPDGTIPDQSGNGNDIALPGLHGLDFAGDTQIVESLGTGAVNGPLTIEYNINFNTPGAQQNIVEVADTGGARLISYVNASNQLEMFFGPGNPSSYNTGYTVEAGVDYHIALTWDGTNARLLVDGVDVGGTAVTGLVFSGAETATLTVGSDTIIATNFRTDAVIGDLRVWDVARTPAEIAADKDAPLDPGQNPDMIANFVLQGADGTTPGIVTDVVTAATPTVTDLGQTGNTATFVDATATAPAAVETTPADTPTVILDVYEDLIVTEDTPFSSKIIAKDVDGDSVIFTRDVDAENGTVIVNPDGTFTYTPNADFSGYDRRATRSPSKPGCRSPWARARRSSASARRGPVWASISASTGPAI